MNRYKWLLTFIMLVSICACHENKWTINSPKGESIRELQKKVFEGDTISYQKLKTIHLDMQPSSFLFWALLMANKHDYSDAYLDVYFSLANSYGLEDLNFSKIDNKTKKIMLEYLILAEKKGNIEAKELLKLKKTQLQSLR